MATDADVDSGRKRTLIQSIEAYTWKVVSGKIHGGIRNIQCKSRLRGTFHHCTIAPRRNIFWRGCFVFMFCRCRGYLYFFTRVPGIFTRVPVLYKGAWFVSHFHHRVFHRALVAQTRQQTCEREFCNEKLCLMSEQLRCIHLILCEILKYDDENMPKILKHLHFNHKGTYIASECVACYPVLFKDMFCILFNLQNIWLLLSN